MTEETHGEKMVEMGDFSFYSKDPRKEVLRIRFVFNPFQVGSAILIKNNMVDSAGRLIAKLSDIEYTVHTYACPICWLCGRKTLIPKHCENCQTFFCSKECFRKGWFRHKKKCLDNN